jgi:hypothetical protein
MMAGVDGSEEAGVAIAAVTLRLVFSLYSL